MGKNRGAEGWFAPDGSPRFELQDAVAVRSGVARYRARDLVLDRDLLLEVGGESLLEVARVLGRLEHPGAPAILASGRDPDGRVFLARELDPADGVRLSDLGAEVSLEARLTIGVAVAGAVAHAASRGVGVSRLDLETVLALPGSRVRVTTFHAGPPDPDGGVAAVQRLLSRFAAPRGRCPPEISRVCRFRGYKSADELADDVQRYLVGEKDLRASRLSRARRIAAWVRRRPGRAAFAAGSFGAGLILAFLAAGAVVLARAEDRRAREAHSIEEARLRDGALGDARAEMAEVAALDLRRQRLFDERRRLHHECESLAAEPRELEVDRALDLLTSEREEIAARILAELEVAGSRGAEVSAELVAVEIGRLEFLFAVAAFEEEKDLSTSTIERARATRPIAQAILASDLDGAWRAVSFLDRTHPYRAAAERLVATMRHSHPSARAELLSLAGLLAARGRLSISGRAGLEASLTEVVRDDQERWGLAAPRRVAPGDSLELDLGVYLVTCAAGGREFRFEVLIERSEEDEVDLSDLPDDLPEGFVWIPAGDFYRGGRGLNPTRYRKAQVARGFAIAVEESSEERGVDLDGAKRVAQGMSRPGWTGRLPTEEEWELAARGVAGRLYPWGDRVLSGDSEVDSSIYGVRRMTVYPIEWTATSLPNGRVVVKGGFWSGSEIEATCASRLVSAPDMAQRTRGVRPVLSRR